MEASRTSCMRAQEEMDSTSVTLTASRRGAFAPDPVGERTAVRSARAELVAQRPLHSVVAQPSARKAPLARNHSGHHEEARPVRADAHGGQGRDGFAA
eukprot:scaffold28757_cov101-Isochrysis_galbana.AAC.3